MTRVFEQVYDSAARLLRRVSERKDSPKDAEAIEVLRGAPLFADLSTPQLRFLSKAVHFRQFKPGEYVYYEGDPGLGMYLVQYGTVHLTVLDEDGEQVEITRIQSGEIFGELSLYGEFNRLETAQALSDCRLVGFFRPDLRSIIKRNPRLGAAVSVALAQRMAERQVATFRLLARERGKLDAHKLVSRAPLEPKDGVNEYLVE